MNNSSGRGDIINKLFDTSKLLRYIIAIVAIYFSIKYILPLLLPFIFGMGIAYAAQSPAKIISSRIPCLSKKFCCIFFAALMMIISAALIVCVICIIFNQAINLCPNIPEYLRQAEVMVENAAHSSSSEASGAWERFVSFAATCAEWVIDFFSENYKQYLPSFLSQSTKILSGLPSFVTALVFAIVSALFAAGDFNSIVRTIKKILPAKYYKAASFAVGSAISTIASLLKTYGKLMFITFCELSAGFLIMNLLGCDTGNIIASALTISIIDILPVLGTGTVLIPWALFEMLLGNSLHGILLLALFAIIAAVRNFLEPKLIGKNLELHPFFTLGSVYIGAKLFGALGIIILPLILMIARDMSREKGLNRAASHESI